MILRKKILGQSAPSGTVATTLYTVPAGYECTVSTFTVCNTLTSSQSFRMAAVPSGTALSNKNYHYYDVVIPGNDTFKATDGTTLGSNDYIVVYASATGLSFSLSGQENN